MIINPKDRIITTQAIITVSSTIISVGILTLPRTATEAMGTPDAWIAVILGGIISMVFGYGVIKFNQCFPRKTFY